MRENDMSGEKQHTITPYFTVEDADGLIAFLSAAFGANLVKCDRYDDGRVQHARLQIGRSLIMLNECSDDFPANVSQMHICVDDADRAYTSAVNLGATSPPIVRCRFGSRSVTMTNAIRMPGTPTTKNVNL